MTKQDIINKYIELAKEDKMHPSRAQLIEAGVSRDAIRHHFGNHLKLQKSILKSHSDELEGISLKKQVTPPKILLFDIETAPIVGYVWGLWDNNVALNQIHTDWSVLSWSAKWLGSDEVLYMDQRGIKNVKNDKKLLSGIWKLLDSADIVITQNGIKFDAKKLNARFVINGFQPPSSYKHIDTLKIAKKHFAFTSNKLEYMCKALDVKYKKQEHKDFPGFELWKGCLAGNLKAWKEMEVYNKYDTLCLEEVYKKLIPWENSIDFNLYHESDETVCTCGKSNWLKNGFYYTPSSKFQRYKCKSCGSEIRDRKSLQTTSKTGTKR